MAFRRRIMAPSTRLLRRLQTTITSATSQKVDETTTTSPTTTYDVTVDGFDAGADYYGNRPGDYTEPFGSIAQATYVDGSGISREVTSVYWIDDANGVNPWYQRVCFCLSDSAAPNTDETFQRIVIGATTYLRSDADQYSGVPFTAGTVWAWDTGLASPLSPAGDFNFEVWAS